MCIVSVLHVSSHKMNKKKYYALDFNVNIHMILILVNIDTRYNMPNVYQFKKWQFPKKYWSRYQIKQCNESNTLNYDVLFSFISHFFVLFWGRRGKYESAIRNP